MSTLYIVEQGAYLRKNGGSFCVTKGDNELVKVPDNSVDSVVIFGNVQVSTQAVSELLNKGCELIYLSKAGNFKGMLEPGKPKNVHMRIAQYDASLDYQFTLQCAKSIISSKISNQKSTITKWERNNWIIEDYSGVKNDMAQGLERIQSCTSIESVRAVEAELAKKYFNVFADVAPPPFIWNDRNRRPPKDPINGLLSLTYMLVHSQIVSNCYTHALDPCIGFIHTLDYSRTSLALDILEPIRSSYCDSFVFSVLQKELFELSDFTYSETSGCRLRQEPFKRFLNLFHEMLDNKQNRKMSLKRYIDKLVSAVCTSTLTREKLNLSIL